MHILKHTGQYQAHFIINRTHTVFSEVSIGGPAEVLGSGLGEQVIEKRERPLQSELRFVEEMCFVDRRLACLLKPRDAAIVVTAVGLACAYIAAYSVRL